MTSPELRYVIGADDTASRVLANVRSNLTGLQTTGTKVKAVLGSLGVSLTAGAVSAFVRGVVDGVDALNDLKDATGASIENLSGLEDVAKRTGTSFDTVGGALVKFNGALKDAKPGSDAEAAFRSLGLSVAKLKALDPAEALRLTAIRLAQFADDGNKARLAQELFGKSLREVAPFLKNLAESGELVAKVTTRQAEEAERFNKQLAALAKNSQDASRSLVGDFLPALNRTLESLTQLSQNGQLYVFLKDQAKGVVGLNKLTGDAGADVNRLLKERTELLDKIGKQRFAGKAGLESSSLRDELFQVNELLGVAQTFMRTKANANIGEYSDQVSRRFERARPTVAFNGGSGSAGGGPKQSEAERYLETLQKQLEKTKDLSVEEQLLTDLQQKRLGVVPAKLRDQLVATAKQVDAARDLVRMEKESAEARVKNSDATRQRIDGLQRENEASVQQIQQMRQGIEEIGLTTSALNELRLARLDAAIAADEETLANARSADADRSELAIIEQRIALKRIERDLTAKSQTTNREQSLLGGTGTAELERKRDDMLFLTDLFERGRIGETQYLEAVTLRLGITNDNIEKTKSLAEELGLTFASAFEDAIVGGKSFSDVLKGLESDIIRIVTRKLVTEPLGNAISGIFSGGGSGGGIGGAISGLFGKIFSFDGGGYTGDGPRAGGMDGLGGRLALLHPKETVIDHTKGQSSGNTINVTIHQSFAAGTNRATTMQAAADASRQLQYAARNL